MKCPCENCGRDYMCGGSDCSAFNNWFKEEWNRVCEPFRKIKKEVKGNGKEIY